MTETVQFRIQLPIGLRDMFKTLCLRSNTTMTDKMINLIEHDVAGLSNTPAPPQQTITALNDDRLIGRVVSACDRLSETAAGLGNSLHTSFDTFEAKLLRSIPKPPDLQELAETQSATAEADQKRLQQILGKADVLNKDIIAAVERGQQQMLKAIASKFSLYQAIGAGTLLGVLASACLLWAIGGTSPARSLAIRLTGQDGTWNAALWIAGNRQPKRTALLSETAGLLQTAEFRESYGRCIERAKRTKRNLSCTVTFPLLEEVR